MARFLSIFTIFCLLAALANPAVAESKRVKVKAPGQAPVTLPNAREAAIEDALRRCVEAGGGVQLASVSQTSNFMLVSDAIYTKTAGYVERYEVLLENPDQDGLYTVQVLATVTRGDINADVEAFKSLLRRKGHPRLLVVGNADAQPFDYRLTAIVQDMLDTRNITVIDVERLQANQRNLAQRAANVDQDVQRAALIAQETGADYLVVLNISGEHLPARSNYGVTTHAADAVGIVKIIEADTAQVLASKVIERRASSDTEQRASRQATSAVVREATNRAIKRVAEHWLEDVDQRGGQQITIAMHRFSFERATNLVEKLRQVEGVRDVIIDRTDAQGVGQIRVVANSSAADVAFVLSKLDRKLQVVSTTASRIDVK